MDFAHLHLIINHVPVIGIPVALAFLIFGLMSKNSSAQRFSLLVLLGLALVVLPVYFTGEPAEEVIEHLPDFSENFIEPHEDAAMFSLILTLLTGASAAVALWFQKDERNGRMTSLFTLILACLAVMSLGYTASLGGQVRHTELRSGFVAPAGETEH